MDGTILLSGFLLFLPHAKALLQGTPVPSTADFYKRRAARILPSYYFITLLLLFAIAIPKEQYASTGAMLRDLFSHLTFTFPFSYATYHGTHLGGASWTLAIEVHMYLLFPLIARLARKNAAGTFLGMAVVGAFFRMYCLYYTADNLSMVLNQMVSFLDVYAIGMACSLLYVRLRMWYEREPQKLLIFEVPATALLSVCICLLVMLFQHQARINGTGMASLQAGQWFHRLPLALLFAGCMVALPFCISPIRLLFGNPVMSFLSGVSMNYYLLHQPIAVLLKDLHIPASVSSKPNVDREIAWQVPYTWLCFSLALLAAILVTYLVEKPGGKLLKKLFTKKERPESTQTTETSSGAAAPPSPEGKAGE